MQLLTSWRVLLIPALAMLAVGHLSGPATAHPPHEPGNGVNETTACRLWAGDSDVTNESAYQSDVDEDEPDVCALAPATDIPLDRPPRAVEQWNREDHAKFPSTGAGRSTYPTNATLAGGRFIRDAHATIFAVQPSTRAHLSPGEHPLYVAPNGTLLGTVDYRVRIPEAQVTDDRQVYWRLETHEIRRTRLQIDGTTVATGSGRHRPAYTYNLEGTSDRSHTLGLAAEVRAVLVKRVRTCEERVNGTCVDWDVRRERFEESLTVHDTIDVEEYDLTVSGFRATFPDGDLGLVLYKNRPWLGYSLPNGGVRGVWRFYAARNEDWDSLVTVSDTGREVAHSPLHPLQVHAYPFEHGPSPEPAWTVKLTETFGEETGAPTLPEDVLLDVVTEPYLASYGMVTRTDTTEHDLEDVRAVGLVQGVTIDVEPRMVADIPISRSNLTVEIENQSGESVTVKVHLSDNETGEPISTASREGYLVVQDRRVNTTSNGTVIATVPRRIGGVTARFEPGSWWRSTHGYTGDTDVASLHSAELLLISVLFELAVPVSLFLLAVFMVDRITGWRIWQPWRAIA